MIYNKAGGLCNCNVLSLTKINFNSSKMQYCLAFRHKNVCISEIHMHSGGASFGTFVNSLKSNKELLIVENNYLLIGL